MPGTFIEYLDILCVPGQPGIGFERIESGQLIANDGTTFYIKDNIPQLLKDAENKGLTTFYDDKSTEKNIHSAVGYWFSSHYRLMHTVFRDLIGKYASGIKIVDIGCGHGEMTRHLVDSHVVFGLDISQGMLKLANASGLIGIRGVAGLMPFKNDCMDVVIAAEMLQHMEYLEAFFTDIARILKPDGRAIVSTISRRSLLRRTHRACRGLRYDDGTILRSPDLVIDSAYSCQLHTKSMTSIYWPFPISPKLEQGNINRNISSLATNFILELGKV